MNLIASVKHNNILSSNLLATSFGHYTIITPSLHEIYKLFAVHTKFKAIWDPITHQC